MAKFKKEKVSFFKKELKALCAYTLADDNPWKDRRPPNPPPTQPKPQPPLPGFPPFRPFF
ncbi:MAG: hypothetical protein LBJ79_00930 [Endomicrobium sp.]|jgi:hypothetical protein|nr:hypothetical protein [Endomicrobium sp.]